MNLLSIQRYPNQKKLM